MPDEPVNPPPDLGPDAPPDFPPDAFRSPPDGADAPGPDADRSAEADVEAEAPWAPATRIVAFGGAAGVLFACVCLGRAALAHTGPAAEGLVMFIGAILLLGAAMVLLAIAILGPPVKPKGVDPIAWQAQRQGLPTDPEAYQDGGLAVAATAFDLEEAHIIANALRQAEIPAWVEGESMAGWYWHLQMGLHRGGIRVLVPAARLAEAQGIMERDRQEAAAALAPEPESDEKDEAAYQLWRSAQRLGFFTALGFTAPVAFFRAIRLLDKIREERKRIGNLPDLRRARRLAWLIILTIVPLALFTLLMLAMMAVR